MHLKPAFVLMALAAVVVLTPEVSSTKLLAKKVLLTAPLIKAAKTKATAIAKGKALALKTAVTLPVELLKSKVATVSKVLSAPFAKTVSKTADFTPVVPAAAIGVLSPLAALSSISPPQFTISGVNPSLSVQYPSSSNIAYVDYFGDGFNGYLRSANGAPQIEISGVPTVVSSGSLGSELVNAGERLIGTTAGAAAAAGLSTISNVATRLSNAADTVENVQNGFLRRLTENPIINYVQNAFRRAPVPVPAPVTYTYLPKLGFTEYHSFQFHPHQYGYGDETADLVPPPAPQPEVPTTTTPAPERAVEQQLTYGLPAENFAQTFAGQRIYYP